MKPHLVYDFIVNKETNTITIHREFAAERTLVWDAFTKQEILEQWWAPKPWTILTKKMDFREGGQWHYAMVGPDGQSPGMWSVVNYIQIWPQQQFTSWVTFTDEDANVNEGMPKGKWDLKFADKGTHTLVVWDKIFEDFKQLEANIAMGFKEGITMTMESLDELLAGLKK